MVKKSLFPALKPMKTTKKVEAPARKAPARKEMAQEAFQRTKTSNVSAPLPMEEMPKTGAPEPSRRLPGQRVIGKGTSGRGTKIIGALYDSQKLYQDVSQPHYRERASRVIKMEESPLVQKIRHNTDIPDSGQRVVRAKMPETIGKKSVSVQSVNQGSREFGTQYADISDMGRVKPVSKRDMAIQAFDESVEETMIDEPDILKPSVNELGVLKSTPLPQAPPNVMNQPEIRLWKELRLGEHIPSADIHPMLTLVPGTSAEMYKNKVSGQDVELKEKEKKPRKPRKAKVIPGMTEVKEEEVVEEMPTAKGIVKTEVEKIEKKEKKKRQPSTYNKFVSEHMKQGKSMKEISEMWKRTKE